MKLSFLPCCPIPAISFPAGVPPILLLNPRPQTGASLQIPPYQASAQSNLAELILDTSSATRYSGSTIYIVVIGDGEGLFSRDGVEVIFEGKDVESWLSPSAVQYPCQTQHCCSKPSGVRG